MKNLSGLPVNLLLRDKNCLVVGGGVVGTFKTQSLLSAGAIVTVVSPEFNKNIIKLKNKYDSQINLVKSVYKKKFIKNKWLVITATDKSLVNAKVSSDCVKKRIWVNSADDPINCEFTLMSLVKRQNLIVAIGTFGKSPAMAKFLKSRIDVMIDDTYDVLIDMLFELRQDLKSRKISTEDINWDFAFGEDIFNQLKLDETQKVKDFLLERIEEQL